MKLCELREDSLVTKWMDSLNASDNTRRSYLQSFQLFTDCLNMTPSEILDDADKDAERKMRDRNIKTFLIRYRRYLQERGLSDLTIQTRIGGVKSWYDCWDIQIPKLQGEHRRANVKEENTIIPTKEDFQAVLKIADPLEKAILLLGITSGMAANEIRNLKISDFKNGLDSDGIATFKIRRIKVKTDYVTFCTLECSKAISEYLEFRQRTIKLNNKKRKEQLLKQRIANDDGYLFVLRCISDDYLTTPDEELRKLDDKIIVNIYRSLSERVRANARSRSFNVLRSHNSRRYYSSVLLNNGADSFFVEYTLGHTLDKTRSAYFRSNADKLKEIYKRYIPYLIIEKSLNISETPEFHRLLEENRILAAQAVKATVERNEIQELREEVTRLNKLTQVTVLNSFTGEKQSVDDWLTYVDKQKEENRKRRVSQ